MGVTVDKAPINYYSFASSETTRSYDFTQQNRGLKK